MKKYFRLIASVLFVLALALEYAFGGSGEYILAYVWGTAAGGAAVTTTWNLQQIPQFFSFSTANTPTQIQIEVNGEGMIFNLDTNGLLGMNGIRVMGQSLANSFLFQLADGLINGKNGTFSITTSAAGAIPVYAWNPVLKGTTYNIFGRIALLANQAFNLRKFAYGSFYNAGATDRYAVKYNDGSIDNIGRDELQQMLKYTQGAFPTNPYNIDNIAPARIDQVQVLAAAAQTAYAMRYVPAYGNRDESALAFLG